MTVNWIGIGAFLIFLAVFVFGWSRLDRWFRQRAWNQADADARAIMRRDHGVEQGSDGHWYPAGRAPSPPPPPGPPPR